MSASGEELPLTVPPLGARMEIPPEPHHVGARALFVASRLLAGATTFFLLAFLFAYFYLRALNQEHMWHPRHVNPDQGLGGAFVACLILSVLLTLIANGQLKRESRSWLIAVIGGLALGLAAIALQCVEYTVQGFGPTNGAYASVFCAWTAFYLFAVLGTLYWLETEVATELRARRAPATRGGGDIADPDKLIAPSLDAATFFWGFLGAAGVVMYVTLYIL
jgi:heme/copper-type cytochrome/quinol oxidase subunit 3